MPINYFLPQIYSQVPKRSVEPKELFGNVDEEVSIKETGGRNAGRIFHPIVADRQHLETTYTFCSAVLYRVMLTGSSVSWLVPTPLGEEGRDG